MLFYEMLRNCTCFTRQDAPVKDVPLRAQQQGREREIGLQVMCRGGRIRDIGVVRMGSVLRGVMSRERGSEASSSLSAALSFPLSQCTLLEMKMGKDTVSGRCGED